MGLSVRRLIGIAILLLMAGMFAWMKGYRDGLWITLPWPSTFYGLNDTEF